MHATVRLASTWSNQVEILAMTVDKLRLELQARKLVSSGTAKTDLLYTLLRAVGLLPPVESTQADAASFADVGLGLSQARVTAGQSFRCSSVA